MMRLMLYFVVVCSRIFKDFDGITADKCRFVKPRISPPALDVWMWKPLSIYPEIKICPFVTASPGCARAVPLVTVEERMYASWSATKLLITVSFPVKSVEMRSRTEITARHPTVLIPAHWSSGSWNNNAFFVFSLLIWLREIPNEIPQDSAADRISWSDSIWFPSTSINRILVGRYMVKLMIKNKTSRRTVLFRNDKRCQYKPCCERIVNLSFLFCRISEIDRKSFWKTRNL